VGRRLAASVVAGDDFYRDLPEERRWALTAAEGVDLYFDWQRLRREALEPLRAGRAARYRPFDWREGAGLAGLVVEVVPTPVIVVDGRTSPGPTRKRRSPTQLSLRRTVRCLWHCPDCAVGRAAGLVAGLVS
jgi:hypothetical protein